MNLPIAKIVAFGLLFCLVARAEETSTGSFQKKFDEDGKVTDSELRSRLGSRSRLSMKFELEYDGPPVGDLSAADQPNPDGTVAPTATGVSGSIGTRYRLSPESALSLNVGVTDQYLFHGSQQTLDVNDPFFFYERSFRAAGIQMVGMFGGSYVTSNVFKSKGEVGGLDERLYSSYHFAGVPLSISNTTKLQYYFFDRAFIYGPVKKGGDGKVRELGLVEAPGLKYHFSDRLNVNTSWHFNFFHSRGIPDPTGINSRLMFERVGAGYAITRDIYVDPYIQFFPTEFSWRTATMNVTTVFSLL